MPLIDRIFRGGFLWSFAIYASDRPFSPNLKLGSPLKLFNSKRLRLSGRHPHTQADPFLMVDSETLFILYEKVERGGVGTIACAKTTDLETFEDCGTVLAEPHHLSWPFVFRHDRQIYMAPESSAAGEIALYRFDDFPYAPVKVRTLLAGGYVDPILIEHHGHWYLFATSEIGLELFVAGDHLNGDFRSHPNSPISTDPVSFRSGGPPIRISDHWVRIAQDCSRNYGENVGLIEITELTPDDYAERVLNPAFFEKKDFWNRDGAHHLSVAEFKGQTVIAADGRHRDYWFNRFIRGRHDRG